MSKEIGVKLKQARVSKKLTIDDVADSLKIRKPFIEAIESGDFRPLPGVAYAIGFIKSYAALVGLNGDELAALVKTESMPSAHTSHIDMPHNHMESALPTSHVIVLSLIILLLGYVAWYFFSGAEKLDMKVPQVPVAEKVQTAPSSDLLPLPKAQEGQEPLAAQIPPPVLSETVVSSTDVTETVEVLQVMGEEYIQDAKARKYGNIEHAKPRIVLTIREDTWLQMQRDEEILLSKVLKESDKYVIADYDETLVMDTGNAGGIEISIDGQTLRPIAPRGVIIRGFTFDRHTLGEYM